MSRWGHVARGLVIGSVLVLSALASAESLKLPFGRTLNVSMLQKATQMAPKELITFIEAQGFKIYLYPSRHPKNADFAGIIRAPADIRKNPTLISLMEDKGQGAEVAEVGMFVPETDEEMGKYGPFLIFAESASTQTLIHEFGHAIFYLGESPEVRKEKSELGRRAWRTARELELQLLYLDRNSVSSVKYHRDQLIEVLIRDVTIEGLRAQDFTTEEVVIETLLSRMIRPGNRNYQPERVKAGLEYARKNIHMVYLHLERREWLFTEIRHLYEQIAGAWPNTSATEREEILDSIQSYRAALDTAKQGVLDELKKLENPEWVVTVAR